MGWASGGYLFGDLMDTLMKWVPDEKTRQLMYAEIILAFEKSDWDTQDECLGVDSAFDAALRALHPDWWEDE